MASTITSTTCPRCGCYVLCETDTSGESDSFCCGCGRLETTTFEEADGELIHRLLEPNGLVIIVRAQCGTIAIAHYNTIDTLPSLIKDVEEAYETLNPETDCISMFDENGKLQCVFGEKLYY